MPSGAVKVDWVENSARGTSSGRPWSAFWGSRELIGYLALRDLKLRYRQAALGVIWVVAQPIAGVAAFTFVFDRLAEVGSQGVPYPLFALVGLVTWTYFASAVTRAGDVLVGNPALVTKVYFPRIAAPAAGLVSPALDLAVSLVPVAALLAYYGVWPGPRVLAAPLWLALLLVTALGFALWFSAANVRYRDVQYALGPALNLWLFLSPVAYPAALLTGWQQLVYSVNPVVGVIGLGRWSLLGAPWPGWSLAVSAASAAVVLAGGLAYFHRAERAFADVI